MSQLTYEASVYSRTVKYTNFNGEDKEKTLYFALDPLQLMQLIASFTPKTNTRSGNPSKRNQPEEFTDEDQLKFVRDLAAKAAGFPSQDGESFEAYPEFLDELAGKAFLVKLASSDGDRKEFAEKVILSPFEAFVNYAVADPTNSPAEVQQFKTMLNQLENLFREKNPNDESLADRKARLAEELAAMERETDESSDS